MRWIFWVLIEEGGHLLPSNAAVSESRFVIPAHARVLPIVSARCYGHVKLISIPLMS